jgi:hypothetical protein
MSTEKKLTTNAGCPVAHNQNVMNMVTYNLALTILEQEVEHEEDLQSLREDLNLMVERGSWRPRLRRGSRDLHLQGEGQAGDRIGFNSHGGTAEVRDRLGHNGLGVVKALGPAASVPSAGPLPVGSL